jgi:thiol-disulfide isomerase/thioredoxin
VSPGRQERAGERGGRAGRAERPAASSSAARELHGPLGQRDALRRCAGPILAALLAAPLAAASWACVAEPKPLENLALLGELAPDLRLEWLDGSPEGKLSDLRGKVVLLEFWRTWCEACQAEVPYLNDLHARYQSDGLAVVGVTNEEQALVRTALDLEQITYPVARTPDLVAERSWGITAVPRAFLVDREGALVWVGHPGALEEGRLRELLYGP